MSISLYIRTCLKNIVLLVPITWNFKEGQRKVAGYMVFVIYERTVLSVVKNLKFRSI